MSTKGNTQNTPKKTQNQTATVATGIRSRSSGRTTRTAVAHGEDGNKTGPHH
jgi:hypothetical protein